MDTYKNYLDGNGSGVPAGGGIWLFPAGSPTYTDGGNHEMGLVFKPAATPGEVNIGMYLDGTLLATQQFNDWTCPTFNVVISGMPRATTDDVTAVFADLVVSTASTHNPGDANGDGRVDINDLTTVLSNFGQDGAWRVAGLHGRRPGGHGGHQRPDHRAVQLRYDLHGIFRHQGHARAGRYHAHACRCRLPAGLAMAFLEGLHCRQHQGNQDAYDRNHHQQLNQREPAGRSPAGWSTQAAFDPSRGDGHKHLFPALWPAFRTDCQYFFASITWPSQRLAR